MSSHQQQKRDSARWKMCKSGRQLVDEALTMAEARGDRQAVANLRYTQTLMILQENRFVLPTGDPSTLLGDDMAPSHFPTSSILIKNPKGGSV